MGSRLAGSLPKHTAKEIPSSSFSQPASSEAHTANASITAAHRLQSFMKSLLILGIKNKVPQGSTQIYIIKYYKESKPYCKAAPGKK